MWSAAVFQQPAETFIYTALNIRVTEDFPAEAEQLQNALHWFHHHAGGSDCRQPTLHIHLVEGPLGNGKAKLETQLEKRLE